jgi:FkbM family methyltransferase
MNDALEQLRRVGLRPSAVIDVGVANGTPDLYRVFPEPTYLLVEPMVEFESTLKATLRSQIRGTYALTAVGAATGRIALTVRGSDSSAYREVDRSDRAVESRTVPVNTLDALCAERELRGPYLLKVDVQGGELEVLAGARRILRETEAIILEVSLLQALVGIPVLADVVQAMDDYGFAVYDLFGGHFRPVDGALTQIDLVFVKTIGRFRRYQGYRPN